MKLSKYLAVTALMAALISPARSETIIDMVVQYDSGRVSVYGEDNLISGIRVSQDIMNVALRDQSDCGVSLRAINYTPWQKGTKTGNQILTDFRNNVTGVNDLINQKGADLACFFVYPPGLNGLASGRYSLVAIIRNQSMAHEIGHCLGCDHGYPSLGSTIGNGYGFVGNSGTRFKDIMASSTTDGTQIYYYSAANRIYDGVPRGIANSRDCGAKINQTKAGIAGYRVRIP
jgi:hypothetical protein